MTGGRDGTSSEIVRQRIRVRGVVQGVGFRPFVYALATRARLPGHVANDGAGVILEVEGEREQLAEFVDALSREAPPLARIDSVQVEIVARARSRSADATRFVILSSERTPGALTAICPDVATCEDCLREMRDPANRRFRYPFINCTNCGPRYTIVRDIPYDRVSTTMACFTMCAACQREYDDPADRRFHAQPNACPDCGPSIRWHPAASDPEDALAATPISGAAPGEDALRAVGDVIRAGGIVAVKGIGGFHLACDAANPNAVARLRRRKRRSDKPLAILVADIAAAERVAHVSPCEADLLRSGARSIVLLRQRRDATLALAPNIAPGQDTLGIMLPQSPLHHLLADIGPLVMTSGNLSQEPIARDNDHALASLAGVADGFLLHDREIYVVCDDSVVRVCSEQHVPIRRSRGYAPYPVCLPRAVSQVLAAGGELKATACVTRDQYAFLTPHIGDVGNLETVAALDRACEHLLQIFDVHPIAIACDLHPAYLSSRWARQLADARALPVIAVQHHHAHLASLMAEHQLDIEERILAFVFDGTGYGTDGGIWGGEVLLGGYEHADRVAHLSPTLLPGGDAAIRHPARVAIAQLWTAGAEWNETQSALSLTPVQRRILLTQLERGVNCATTTSMGRFLDAASSLSGGRHSVTYEGQGAMEFEAIAQTGDASVAPYRFDLGRTATGAITFSGAPVLRQVVADTARRRPVGDIARAVHAGIAECMVEIAESVRESHGIDRVGLTGGVFQNVLLLSLARTRLQAAGFTILTHHLVPPNDGGLALGQAMIATMRGPGTSTAA